MVIALLAVLGVDLIVLVVFVAVVLSRKRWVRHQPVDVPVTESPVTATAARDSSE
jgi:hypothetical protein